MFRHTLLLAQMLTHVRTGSCSLAKRLHKKVIVAALLLCNLLKNALPGRIS